MRVLNPSQSGVGMRESHPMEHMNIENYAVRALWNADGNGSKSPCVNCTGCDGCTMNSEGFYNAAGKKCSQAEIMFGLCGQHGTGTANAEGYHNAGGERMSSFFQNLFPNRGGTVAAKNEASSAAAALDLAIAQKLAQQQAAPTGMSTGKKVGIAAGVIAGVGLAVVLIMHFRNKGATKK